MGVSCATFVTVNLKERKRPVFMICCGDCITYSDDGSEPAWPVDRGVNVPEVPDDSCIVPEGVGDNLYMKGPVPVPVPVYGLRKNTLYKATE